MLGKRSGILRAYLGPVLWVAVGFALAELLRWQAAEARMPALATAATWLSLACLVAATLRALWVTWRLWRGRGGSPAA